MNPQELQEKIALYYSKLPSAAQKVFSGMEWLQTLEGISQKYGLNDGQKQTLGTETTLALLGIIHLVEYEENLTNQLGLREDTAEKLFGEIENSVIKNIRPQLVQAFEANTQEGEKKTITNDELRVNDAAEKAGYKDALYEISKTYNLTVTQMYVLEKAVADLMEGTIKPEQFVKNLSENLKMPVETVKKIINDTNQKIFKNIRGELAKTMPPVRQNIAPESRENILKRIEKPELIAPKNEPLEIEAPHPILAQKLTQMVQTKTTRTDHTLGNPSNKSPSAAVKPAIDPYREIPE